MNFRKVINSLELLVKNHKQVMAYGVGDIKQLSYFIQGRKDSDNVLQENQPDNKSSKFPLVYIIPQPVSRDRRTKTYSFYIIVADILSEDYSNEVDIWSDTLQIAEDILAQFGYAVTEAFGNYYEEYDIVTPTSITPFSEKYDDYLSGWNLQLNLIVPEPLDRCDAAFEGFTNFLLQENDDFILQENNGKIKQE